MFLVSIIVPDNNHKIVMAVAFAIGIAWSEVLQIVRTKLTEMIEAALRDIRRK